MNEFIARNGLIAQNNSTVSGSLVLVGSGSGLFTVDGTKGRIFTIDDTNSGSLFSVATGSTSILEVFSSNLVIITGSLDVSSGITGSLYGTASWAISSSYASQSISSSYALTASYALNASTSPGVGSSVIFTQSASSTTWVFQHNLGGTYVTIDVYDGSNNIIIPQNITATNANTLTITFGVATSGHAVATVGGGLPAISASYANYILQVNPSGSGATWSPAVSSSFAVSASYATTASYVSTVGFNFVQSAPSSTWTIVHNLNNRYPLVQIYDTNNLTFIPQSINGSDVNTVIVTFSTAVSGYARVI